MSVLSAEQARAFNRPVSTYMYAPIAKSLLVMDSALQEKMVKKFYVLAKRNMAFRKYPELESRHGVNLGQTYAMKDSAKTFTHYIAESQCNAFIHCLSNAQYALFVVTKIIFKREMKLHFKSHRQRGRKILKIGLEYHRHKR